MTATAQSRISPWAVASVLCSLVFFCPLTTMLGVVLGLVALWRVHKDPQRTGTGLAFTGLALGAVFTGLFVAGGIWWNDAVRRPMLYGPHDALVAGFQGDIDAFRNGFVGPGATAPNQAAQDFLNRLRSRYGQFILAGQDQFAASDDQAMLIRTGSARIGYELTFTGGTVQALGEYVLREEKQGFLSRFRYLAVFDAVRGPLVYPPSLADEAMNDRQSLREQTVQEAVEQEQRREPAEGEQLPGERDAPAESGEDVTDRDGPDT